jgi:hypothetical protein
MSKPFSIIASKADESEASVCALIWPKPYLTETHFGRLGLVHSSKMQSIIFLNR